MAIGLIGSACIDLAALWSHRIVAIRIFSSKGGHNRPDSRKLGSSEESCIRRAVNERGLNSGPVGLADAIPEDEADLGLSHRGAV